MVLLKGNIKIKLKAFFKAFNYKGLRHFVNLKGLLALKGGNFIKILISSSNVILNYLYYSFENKKKELKNFFKFKKENGFWEIKKNTLNSVKMKIFLVNLVNKFALLKERINISYHIFSTKKYKKSIFGNIKLGFFNFFKKLKKPEENHFYISFDNRICLIIPDRHKLYAHIWYFIHSSTYTYFRVKNIDDVEFYKLNKTFFTEFYEKYKIVDFEEFLDSFENNGETITVYKKMSDRKKKDLSKKILEISKLLNYPAFFLEIIRDYSTMLITPYDENLYLIPNEKDRLAIMNVNLNDFILTNEQLDIFIESLELHLKLNNDVYFSSYIEELIKNLKKKSLKKKFKFFFSNFFEKLGQFGSLVFYLFSPIIIYSFLTYLFNILPLIIIELFILWFIYFIFKFLLPFFKKKQYFLGLFCLLKKIIFYCWTQKILFFFLIPSFGWYLSLFKTNNNLLNFLFPKTESLIINYMFTMKDQAKKKIFSTFIDVGSAIKILKLNPLLCEGDLEETQKKLVGSLFYRSFYRTPQFYKRFLNTALNWSFSNQQLEKKNFF